jgi:hypothetical protein
MKEAHKRDFVNQMLQLCEKEKDNLISNGFSPDAKMTELTEKKVLCDNAEIKQQEIKAKAQEATAEANRTLEEAYKAASNLADIISGVLGKESEIVKKMRTFRN